MIDGKVDGTPTALPMALDESGRFKYLSLTNVRPQVGTVLPQNADYVVTAGALVDSLRAGNCKATYALLQPGTRLDYGNIKTFCRKFDENFLTKPAGFAARLQADPEAKPVELGATRDLAFFGVATDPAGYRTIVVGSAGNDSKVYDVVPATR